MGKVRGLRARVHQAAVRPKGEAACGSAPPAWEAAPPQAPAAGAGGKDWAFVDTDVFARTKIDRGALVQSLELDTRSVTSIRRGEGHWPCGCRGQGHSAQEGEAEAETGAMAA
ncbi:ribosome biogenesis protein SLX9-like protein isoform 2, partial [Daubentonia madagascariensis]